MFGVIPKSMWSRLLAPDDNNLVPMVTNLFVLRAHGKHMIFDIGLGDTLTDREKKIYGTDGVSCLESSLTERGLTVADIDTVILTHLHTDHAGGAVIRRDGKYVPRFPNARYIVSRGEWENAMHPDERTAAVYVPERLRPLAEAGQIDFIDGDTELFPGIRAVRTGGHTMDHFGLEIESGGQKVVYYADIFCSAAHLRVPFVPATDLYPLDTMAFKRRVLPDIVDRGVVMAFDHDVTMPLARVESDGKHLVARPID
ncbi:MAG: MBL fold metallo-hydrolase [candidate division Zixibacteria bacterium]|nr:MBL fold metallo-hydrolase [candidate division Zixibacteria bacterium]